MTYNMLPAIRTVVQDSINACSPAQACVPSLKIQSAGCHNNSIIFTPTNLQNEGTAPTYAWFLNNNQVATGFSYTLTNAQNGDKVFAKMTSNATCIAASQTPVNSDTITLNCIVTTPVVTVDGLEYYRLVPNPNNGNFAVQLKLNKSMQVQYRLLNTQGKLLFQTNKERVQGVVIKAFTVFPIVSGIYLVEIMLDGKKLIKKMLVE